VFAQGGEEWLAAEARHPETQPDVRKCSKKKIMVIDKGNYNNNN